MSTFRRLTRDAVIWAAIITSSGSVVAGIISRGGDEPSRGSDALTAETRAPPGYCLELIQGTAELAEEHPSVAAAYEQGSFLPQVWTNEEEIRCDGEGEALLGELVDDQSGGQSSAEDAEGPDGQAGTGGSQAP